MIIGVVALQEILLHGIGEHMLRHFPFPLDVVFVEFQLPVFLTQLISQVFQAGMGIDFGF